MKLVHKGTQKSAKSGAASKGFTEEERAAIRGRAEEMKAGGGKRGALCSRRSLRCVSRIAAWPNGSML